MASDPDSDEPTQETEHGYEIPVPKRGDVFGALRKVAKRPEPNGEDDAEGSD